MLAWTLAALAAPDGIALQYGVCISCHGVHGEGRPALQTPRIGDLEPAYVEAQLRAFRDGTRAVDPEHPGSLAMAAIARGLPEASVEPLSVYVASLQPEVLDPGEADPAGAAAWAGCVACHGADGTGNPALNAPSLLYQEPSYLAYALESYREGRRGGPGAAPSARTMQPMASTVPAEKVPALLAHLASLRPERPAPEDPPVTASREQGLAAFEAIHAVATHPRCANCHPDGDAPLQGDAATPHVFGITRFSPLQGVHCGTCHAPRSVGEGTQPLPPADPFWSLAPARMVFVGRTPSALCAQLKDPAINGGRGLVGTIAHVRDDHLLQTSWHSGRTPPPISHADLVERFETWAAAGAPCP